MAKVSERMGIPETTLADWKKTAWWDETLVAVRSEKESQILADNEQVMELAQQELVDRLENGDVQLFKTTKGVEQHRVPVKAKELSIIKGIAEDKRRIQLNMPTSISSNQGSKENIRELALFFAGLGRNSREGPAIDSIEGEFEDVSKHGPSRDR